MQTAEVPKTDALIAVQNAFLPVLKAHPFFELIGNLADRQNLEVYVVGGYVRDFVLGRPCKDIDLVTLGDCLPLAEEVAHKIGNHRDFAVFKNFGTAQIKFDDWIIEFVSARKESYRSESRKPEVQPATLAEDQQRRDFTINALSVCLNKARFGQWIDPFGGLADIKTKTIRTPGNPALTFSDDPLRMMRAVRFAAQLGFDIDADTFSGLQEMKDRLQIVSGERIADELNKIVESNPPSYGFKLLYYSGLLSVILPEMVALAGVENRDGKAHKDNFFHTLEVLDNVARVSPDLWLRWAAILHDIAKPATKRFVPGEGWTFHGHEERGARMVPGLFKRLKLPLNDHMRYVQKLVRLHLRPISLTNEAVTDSAVRRLMFEAGPDLEDLMVLCRADITTKNPAKAKRYLEKFDRVEEKLALVEEKDKLRQFQPVLSGEMIMEIFAIPPSKPVGWLKEQLREAILEGHIKNTLPECLFLALQLGQGQNLLPYSGFDGEQWLNQHVQAE